MIWGKNKNGDQNPKNVFILDLHQINQEEVSSFVTLKCLNIDLYEVDSKCAKYALKTILHITFCLDTIEEKIMNTIMIVCINHPYTYFK